MSSAIAGYLLRDEIDEFIYIHIDDQHPDTLRFNADCEKVLGKPILTLQSRFKSVEEIVRYKKYIGGPGGYPCTSALKIKVRQAWEKENKDFQFRYVWGFDANELARAHKMEVDYHKHEHAFPLMDKYLVKEDVHGLLKRLGIQRPAMYDLGFKNNNCLGCLKGGIGYWNKIRIYFPEVFASRAKLEHIIGASCINGVYLDELDPERGNYPEEVEQECGMMCVFALNGW